LAAQSGGDVRESGAAEALVRAQRDTAPIEPLTENDPRLTADEAYRIQQLVVAARLPSEGPVVGYKVGLTSRAMQEQLGIDTPDFSPILSSMLASTGAVLPRTSFIQPRVEAEIAFVLARGLRGPGVDAEGVLAATSGVMAAIEVIDSRIVGWRIKLADTIADLASSAGVVTSGRLVPLDGLALEDVQVRMERDGQEVSSGVGAAVLGHPATAAAWLVNTLGQKGVALEAGHLVMPGAMHAAVPAEAGNRFRAIFDRLGEVEVAFA
jgi:2-keto-4-pentenoate hydratase